MNWRERWALLDCTEIGHHQTWYRFQYLDGTQRCIVADGRRLAIGDVCALLDDAETRRPHVDRALLDRVD